ncbi:MAG TPA: 3-phosphoshikimate 1-carboxyvinyltransferase [Chitinophagaceae bacterium]
MIATVQPSTLGGIIHAPASKSSMQRACAAALLAKGTWLIRHAGISNDDKAALSIVTGLGCRVEAAGNDVIISGEGIRPVADTVHCGESGLSIRMFTPLVAIADREITITGEGSLVTRPMDFFDRILPALNVSVRSNNGRLPLAVKGPLQPQNISIDGSLSSQFLTGLLMAYAAAGANGVSIKVDGLASKPYIDLTLDVMKKFGLPVPVNRNYEEFIFQHNVPAAVIQNEYTVEGDWSGGAFLLVAGLIAGPITVRGLDLLSTQADRKIMEALQQASSGYAIEAKGIRLHPGGLRPFRFDATDCPDLFPPLVALAAYCEGDSVIRGVGRLTHKESNRAASLKSEFEKFGVSVNIAGDEMIIGGGRGLKGAQTDSHHDHRIAMACAIAGLRADGDTVIAGADAVNKSYPAFFGDLESLHARVSLNNKIRFHE